MALEKVNLHMEPALVPEPYQAAAVNSLVRLAEKGVTEAQLTLAEMYEAGDGVPVDHEKATHWYELASLNTRAVKPDGGLSHLDVAGKVPRKPRRYDKLVGDDPLSQCDQAYMYAHGIGVEQNLPLAAELYTQAANRGCAAAQTSLGFMYEHGLGVPQNREKAAELYRSAAAQGDPAALNNLGFLLATGGCLPRNSREAVGEFEKAAAHGDPYALCNLGVMYHNGEGVPQDYKRAAEFYKKAAEHGIALAKYNLGLMYQYGQGVKADQRKSQSLCRSADATIISRKQPLSEAASDEDVLDSSEQLGQLPAEGGAE